MLDKCHKNVRTIEKTYKTNVQTNVKQMLETCQNMTNTYKTNVNNTINMPQNTINIHNII